MGKHWQSHHGESNAREVPGRNIADHPQGLELQFRPTPDHAHHERRFATLRLHQLPNLATGLIHLHDDAGDIRCQGLARGPGTKIRFQRLDNLLLVTNVNVLHAVYPVDPCFRRREAISQERLTLDIE